MQHTAPILTATPQGILMDGMHLNKSVSNRLPPQVIRYIERLKSIWQKSKRQIGMIAHPTRRMIFRLLLKHRCYWPSLRHVLFRPVLNKANFNSEEARDHGGRWISTDGVTAEDLKNPRFKGMGRTQIKKQKFVDAHLAAAETVSIKLKSASNKYSRSIWSRIGLGQG